MNPARAFLRANQALALRISRLFPHARFDIFAYYDDAVVAAARDLKGGVIADVGGGKSCSWAHRVQSADRPRIIAVDISEEELALNQDVDETRVADATNRLPFADGEVDLLVSRTVVEHVADNDAFAREALRVLKPGGRSIHMFPGRYAHYAIIARVVPFRLALWLLHLLRPESKGIVEFQVHYDRTTPSAMGKILRGAGFEDVRFRVSYFASLYFDWFLPLFLVSMAWEVFCSSFRLRNLAAYVLYSARKPLDPAAGGDA